MEPAQAGSPAAERARGSPVEDYALIGDTHTAALVGRNGSIDWLCLPGFDSGACFAALLGGEEHGFWRIAPVGAADCVVRVEIPPSCRSCTVPRVNAGSPSWSWAGCPATKAPARCASATRHPRRSS